MENVSEIRKQIRIYNKTKNVPIYSQILDLQYPDRPKCSCCGKEIIYPHTKIHVTNDGIIYPVDGCFKTTKVIDGNTYNLSICYDCLSKKYEIKNPARCFNVMSEITAYAFNIPQNDFLKSRSEYALTLNNMIAKYGEDEGKKRWNEYCKKQSDTNKFEYKQKKYGWTIDEFTEYNQSRAVTLKNMIKRYGENEGKKRWNEYCKKQSDTKSWEYMVNKFGEKKARSIILQRLTGINQAGYSKISQELFQILDEKLGDGHITHFATKDYEVEKQYGSLTYKLDYFVEDLNVCVEFNGSIFHADPRLFKDDDHPNPFNKKLTAKAIRQHDFYRYKILEDVFGIKTIVVWEMDYKHINIDELIQKILK